MAKRSIKELEEELTHAKKQIEDMEGQIKRVMGVLRVDVVPVVEKGARRRGAFSIDKAAAMQIQDLQVENADLSMDNERLRSLLAGIADTIDQELNLSEEDDDE